MTGQSNLFLQNDNKTISKCSFFSRFFKNVNKTIQIWFFFVLFVAALSNRRFDFWVLSVTEGSEESYKRNIMHSSACVPADTKIKCTFPLLLRTPCCLRQRLVVSVKEAVWKQNTEPHLTFSTTITTINKVEQWQYGNYLSLVSSLISLFLSFFISLFVPLFLCSFVSLFYRELLSTT